MSPRSTSILARPRYATHFVVRRRFQPIVGKRRTEENLEVLTQAHAASMPVTVWAVSRLSPRLVPGQPEKPGFDDAYLSTPHQRFTCVRLPWVSPDRLVGQPFPQRSPPTP